MNLCHQWQNESHSITDYFISKWGSAVEVPTLRHHMTDSYMDLHVIDIKIQSANDIFPQGTSEHLKKCLGSFPM